MPNPPISIAGTEIARIEYQGQQVVTLAMVDKVHQRLDGTARRNFNENRVRFVEGEDFIELTSDEIRTMTDAGAFPPRTARGTLITRRGYLKLVKSLNDDKAWEVFDEMIDRYFVAVDQEEPVPTQINKLASVFGSLKRIARLAGLEGNQSILSAAQAARRITGTDPLALIGATHLTAPQNEILLTPSDIGVRLGLTGRQVNELLVAEGFQTFTRDKKKRIQYEPTHKGIAAGGVMQDTGKQAGGTPVRQLKWASRIIDVLLNVTDGAGTLGESR